jgi:hypothetical protein
MRGVLLIVAAGCGRIGFQPVVDGESPRGYRDEVFADDPLAYWRLDDDGATARDETGRSDGAYSAAGCTQRVPGALVGDPDRAVQFDGDRCEIDVGEGFAFATNAPFTVELWCKLTAGGGSFQQLFARQTRSGDPIDGYALVRGTTDPDGLYFERVIGTEVLATAAHQTPPSTFVHTVAVYDGADSALYINGARSGSFFDDRAMRVHVTRALIGAVREPPATGNHFAGVIDEVAIYGVALPIERIQAHYAIGSTGPR